MNTEFENKTNEELKYELDDLYEEISGSGFYTDIVHKIVELEIELEKRSNI